MGAVGRRTVGATAVLSVVAGAVTFAGVTAWNTREVPGPVSFDEGPQVVVAAPAPEPVQTANPQAAGAREGDVLDVDPGALPGELVSHELSDGRFVVVDPAGDVPQLVVDDLTARATTRLEAAGDDLGAFATAYDELDTAATAGTGRSLVLVFLDQVANDPGDGVWMFRARSEDGSYTSAGGTRQETVDAAQAWITDNGEDEYVLVVAG